MSPSLLSLAILVAPLCLALVLYTLYDTAIRKAIFGRAKIGIKKDGKNQSDQTAIVGLLHSRPPPRGESIVTLLTVAARTTKSLYFYEPGNTTRPIGFTYAELFQEAQDNAHRLRGLSEWTPGGICLIYLDNHLNNIKWFWSVIFAGGIPAMCSSFTPGDAQAKLEHLCKTLTNPLLLNTRARSDDCLNGLAGPNIYFIEDLLNCDTRPPKGLSVSSLNLLGSTTVAIMLTSGSSGNSKAVPLTNSQILTAVDGKCSAFSYNISGTILNWVSMDHVAGLVEAHLRGLFLCKDQVHIEAADIMRDPALYLELLHRHDVSTSFAPNFLLARLIKAFDSGELKLPSTFSLKNLRNIASGGEACTTEVCQRMNHLLQQYGAPANVITPGFGMTETCAGCIFGYGCPTSHSEHTVAPVGRCIPGVDMRITSLDDPVSALSFDVQNADVVGNLELRGPVVFTGYLDNVEANTEAFTTDGWFRTGDIGFINQHGDLTLTGRAKDVICINGINHLAIDQERAIEAAKIPGITPGYIVCFARRPSSDTASEQCCVVYQHSYEPNDTQARALAETLISKAILLNTGTRPFVLPLPPGVLERSSLGKLSRSKISQAFESGLFAAENAHNVEMLGAVKPVKVTPPTNATERELLNIVESTLQLTPGELGIDTGFFDAGITSVDLIRLRSRICRDFGLITIGLKEIITNNTVRLLGKAIRELSAPNRKSCYDPVVRLKASSPKTPLWLVHPGVGEVLVFVGLAQRIQNRPVYALRARGFDGETVFGSIDEVVSTYVTAIRSCQPRGPYAIAGYSYGSMIAFEIAKQLEAMGENVGFLGCLNLPPHIKSRMRQLNIRHCLVHLALFLRLIDDRQTSILEKETLNISFDSALDLVLSYSDRDRWQELDLSREGISRWVHVAYSLQSMAVDYDPSGNVRHIDIFYCDPLAIAARSKTEWVEEHLSKWQDFSRTSPTFHPVDGAHYTMLSSDHVESFHRTLEKVLLERDL